MLKRFGSICTGLLVLLICVGGGAPAAAQTPNTAAILVVVVDQTAGVIRDAKIAVINSATGALREVVSAADGTVTVGALTIESGRERHAVDSGEVVRCRLV